MFRYWGKFFWKFQRGSHYQEEQKREMGKVLSSLRCIIPRSAKRPAAAESRTQPMELSGGKMYFVEGGEKKVHRVLVLSVSASLLEGVAYERMEKNRPP